MRVVLASANLGKRRELEATLAPLGFELVGQGDCGIHSVEETGLTFVENALQKARHAALQADMSSIGDDSGLVVRALDGAPGIYSARYAGADAADVANNRKLINALQDKVDRSAYFYCALVFMRHAADPSPLIATAKWTGQILDHPRGDNGFGYDPIFFLPDHQMSAAELGAEIKNTISHRGQAASKLCQQLLKIL